MLKKSVTLLYSKQEFRAWGVCFCSRTRVAQMINFIVSFKRFLSLEPLRDAIILFTYSKTLTDESIISSKEMHASYNTRSYLSSFTPNAPYMYSGLERAQILSMVPSNVANHIQIINERYIDFAATKITMHQNLLITFWLSMKYQSTHCITA